MLITMSEQRLGEIGTLYEGVIAALLSGRAPEPALLAKAEEDAVEVILELLCEVKLLSAHLKSITANSEKLNIPAQQLEHQLV